MWGKEYFQLAPEHLPSAEMYINGDATMKPNTTLLVAFFRSGADGRYASPVQLRALKIRTSALCCAWKLPAEGVCSMCVRDIFDNFYLPTVLQLGPDLMKFMNGLP